MVWNAMEETVALSMHVSSITRTIAINLVFPLVAMLIARVWTKVPKLNNV